MKEKQINATGNRFISPKLSIFTSGKSLWYGS